MRDEVAVNGIGRETQVRLYVSPALAHSVNLGLLQVKALLEGGRTDDGGNREDALSSDAGKYDILFHVTVS